jgi:hypothetical protein
MPLSASPRALPVWAAMWSRGECFYAFLLVFSPTTSRLSFDAKNRPNDRSLRSLAMADISLASKGEEKTADYRVFFNQGGKPISPWHDIPLKVTNSARRAVGTLWCPCSPFSPPCCAMQNPGSGPTTFNYVCEIPKFTTAKMEVATKEVRILLSLNLAQYTRNISLTWNLYAGEQPDCAGHQERCPQALPRPPVLELWSEIRDICTISPP